MGLSLLLISVGFVCYVHAVYLLYFEANESVRGFSGLRLSGGIGALLNEVHPAYMIAVAETTVGLLLIVSGYVLRNPFEKSSLADVTKNYRYDRIFRNDDAFVMFNTRGAASTVKTDEQ